jgi:hypothetical protein
MQITPRIRRKHKTRRGPRHWTAIVADIMRLWSAALINQATTRVHMGHQQACSPHKAGAPPPLKERSLRFLALRYRGSGSAMLDRPRAVGNRLQRTRGRSMAGRPLDQIAVASYPRSLLRSVPPRRAPGGRVLVGLIGRPIRFWSSNPSRWRPLRTHEQPLRTSFANSHSCHERSLKERRANSHRWAVSEMIRLLAISCQAFLNCSTTNSPPESNLGTILSLCT